MSKESTLLLLGVLIVLAPFLGLPYAWLMVVLPVCGVGIVALSIALKKGSVETIHEAGGV